MTFIPWPRKLWFVLIVCDILIPVLGGFVCCFLMNRNNFNFNSQNKSSKAPAYRLSVRLLAVFCFLLIGYILDKHDVMIIFNSDFLNFLGEHVDAIESLLSRIFFYIVVAVFSIAYAVTEYLFVASESNYSTDN